MLPESAVAVESATAFPPAALDLSQAVRAAIAIVSSRERLEFMRVTEGRLGVRACVRLVSGVRAMVAHSIGQPASFRRESCFALWSHSERRSRGGPATAERVPAVLSP